MQRICRSCRSGFEAATDTLLYENLEVPPPTICTDCSHQRRFAFRNERAYYRRRCDLTGKEIVSIYDPKGPYTVYHREVWFSDRYDPLSYGREIDFSRPFFDQLKELSLAVPWEHMVLINCQNCDYCNYAINSKNCYLCVRTDSEDCYYCYLPFNGTRNCMDCYNIVGCELCYECIDCTSCRECRWVQRCKQCSNVDFCKDCVGCTNCFGCIGLRHKQYHFFNEPLSKKEYEERVQECDTSSHGLVLLLWQRMKDLDLGRPHRSAVIDQTEDATGDYIVKSRRIRNSFDIEECEDVADSIGIEYGKDVARAAFLYHPELSYEQLSITYSQRVRFSYGVYGSNDIEYCMMVHNGSHDCFGCVGLKRNSYCILNKQYPPEEYRVCRERLVKHMKDTKEYGQFFSPSLSPFAYNETVAQEYYPLTKKEALIKGYRWKDDIDEIPKVEKIIPAELLPDAIDDIPDDILNWALKCEMTKRPFRIMNRELSFYHKHRIPIPRFHPDERHRRRMALRNPRKLWQRKCDKCGKDIQTTYAPDRPEIMYCESCYLKEVY